MKTRFYKTAAALLMGTAFLTTACQEDKLEDTVTGFPETFSEIMEQSSIYNFTASPSADWSIELSDKASTYFYFVDEELDVETYRISGKAGNVEAAIYTSSNIPSKLEECIVTMTIGGKKQQIGTLTLNAGKPYLILKYASFNEETGEFSNTCDQQYDFESETAVLPLQWDGYRYALPVEVKTNFKYRTAIIDEGKEGLLKPFFSGNEEGEDLLLADPTKYPLQDEKLTLGFYSFDGAADDEPYFTLNVTVPSAADNWSVSGSGIKEYICFDYAGGAGTDMNGEALTSVLGFVTAADGIRIVPLYQKPFDNNDWVCGDDVDWVTITLNDPASSADVLKLREFTIAVDEEYNGDFRQATLLALPASQKDVDLAGIFDKTNGLKEEYRKYAFANVYQEPENVAEAFGIVKRDEDYLSNMGITEMQYSKFERLSVMENGYLVAETGTTEIYSLIANHEWSADELFFKVDAENYTFAYRNAEGAAVDYNPAEGDPEEWWLDAKTLGNGSTRIYMNIDESNKAYWLENEFGPDGGVSGYIDIKDASGKIIACIVCNYNEDADFGGGDEKAGLSLGANNFGCTLTKITSAEMLPNQDVWWMYESNISMGAEIYHLNCTGEFYAPVVVTDQTLEIDVPDEWKHDKFSYEANMGGYDMYWNTAEAAETVVQFNDMSQDYPMPKYILYTTYTPAE